MAVLFLTGFPGFLGSTLLPRLLADRPVDRAVCLVQPRWAPLATQAVGRLAHAAPHTRGRIELTEGDIVEPDLALARASWQTQVTEAFHFAAAYELGVPRAIAQQVNVDGTRHVLRACGDWPHLQRFHYVSTCFVSGRYDGVFHEADLDVGQTFNNHYEESKALAERHVREAMRSGLATTVYRPAVVVGDTQTGETQKFDGPYCVLQLLLKQPRIAIRYAVGVAGIGLTGAYVDFGQRGSSNSGSSRPRTSGFGSSSRFGSGSSARPQPQVDASAGLAAAIADLAEKTNQV